MSYSALGPNLLPALAGNGTEGAFLPFQLFAGEDGVVTTDETIAQLGNLPAYVVMGRRADDKLVPVAPASSDAAGAVVARGSITFNGQPAVNDTVTVADTVFTFIANGAQPVGNQIPIGAATQNTAEALAFALYSNEPVSSVNAGFLSPNVVTLEADTAGTAGNAITLAKSSANLAISGATLTGGSNSAAEQAPESLPIAILAQPVDTTNGDVQSVVFTGGVFNFAALLWPPGTTFAQAKAMTDRCNFSVRLLK